MKNNVQNWLYLTYQNAKYNLKTSDYQKLIDRLYLIYDDVYNKLPSEISFTNLSCDAIAENEIFINNCRRVLVYFNDLYNCETKIINPTKKRELSVNILMQYLNQIFEQNKLIEVYTDGSTSISTKQSYVQRNIEEKKIKESLFDLLYSIQLYETVKNKKSNPITMSTKRTKLNNKLFLRKKKETLQLLVENEILNKNHEFNTNSIFFKPRKQAILLVKLGGLKIININNKSNTIKYFNELFNSKIHESNVSDIYSDLNNNKLKKNDKTTMEELAFLDELSK